MQLLPQKRCQLKLIKKYFLDIVHLKNLIQLNVLERSVTEVHWWHKEQIRNHTRN